ncbi:MAG: hypothetical protein CM1200mP14_24700 [Gammaproteobacteria bacterium]|nr:MAG: hypothetical protein CM1200mP14_24700 [Gammaproteobacteria bacterium]
MNLLKRTVTFFIGGVGLSAPQSVSGQDAPLSGTGSRTRSAPFGGTCTGARRGTGCQNDGGLT